MIPAPDAMRCEARHPSSSLLRCFKVTHGPEEHHQHEEPSTNPAYHATHVRCWRDGPPPPSDFPEGPYVDRVHVAGVWRTDGEEAVERVGDPVPGP